MSEIDSFLLTETNASAHRYTVKHGGFNEFRSLLIRRLALSSLVSAATMFGVLYYVQGWNTGPMAVILPVLFLGILVFSFVNNLKKQRVLFESFVLIIDDESIVRQQQNTPDMRILKSDVRSIERNSRGYLIIKGRGVMDFIAIPAQIGDRQQLEAELQLIQTIGNGKTAPWKRFLPVVLVLAFFALGYVAFTASDKWVIGVSGVLFCLALAASVFATATSKHLDHKTRRFAYVGIIPMLSVCVMLYTRFTGAPSGEKSAEWIVRDDIFFSGVDIYFLGDHELSLAEIHQTIAKELPDFVYAESEPDSVVRDGYILKFIRDDEGKGMVDSTMLPYFAEDLTPDEMHRLAQADRGVRVMFFGNSRDIVGKQMKISAAMHALIQNRAMVLMDAGTSQYFDAKSWKEHRLDNFDSITHADVTSQITIHAYREEEFCRAVTLGMQKFGLPEISVSGFPCTNQASFGQLINAVAQTLFEHPFLEGDTSLVLRLAGIRNESVHEHLLEGVDDGQIESEVRVSLQFVEPQPGDNPFAQVMIRFSDPAYTSPQEEQQALTKRLFGAEESLKAGEHTDLVLAASERARQKLPALREQFNSKITDDALLLKAPFVYDDGNEWMWVEVTRWEGDVITGILQNDPYYVPDLKAGSTVTVKQEDIFDYILQKSDGTSEGNETGALLEQQE